MELDAAGRAEQQARIAEVFAELGTDNLTGVLERLAARLSYGLVRLLRAAREARPARGDYRVRPRATADDAGRPLLTGAVSPGADRPVRHRLSLLPRVGPRILPAMGVLDWLLGRPLSNDEAEHQQIGPLAGIPVLGLDALSSAAYGPEAALTLLIPLGAAGLAYVGPISALIIGDPRGSSTSPTGRPSTRTRAGAARTPSPRRTWAPARRSSRARRWRSTTCSTWRSASPRAWARWCRRSPRSCRTRCRSASRSSSFLTLVNLRGLRESGFAFMLPTYISW